MRIYYRLSDTTDPEERLEDAALMKALKDELGPDLAVLDAKNTNENLKELGIGAEDVILGRHQRWQGPHPGRQLAPPFLAYWDDPAFLAAAGRTVVPCTFDQANAEVARLHGEGKDAFIKSTTTKEFTSLVKRGSTIHDVADALIYSWLDHDRPVLLVQEAVEMRYEHRFAVMGRQIVSHSPVMIPLTPLDAAWTTGMVAFSPISTKLEHRPDIVAKLKQHARQLAQALEVESCIIDCCMIGDEPAAIELNALSVGQFGLYGMNVRELAQGVVAILLPAAGFQLRQDQDDEELAPDF